MACSCDEYTDHDRYSPGCPYKKDADKLTQYICTMGRLFLNKDLIKDLPQDIRDYLLMHAVWDRGLGRPWGTEQDLTEVDAMIKRFDDRVKDERI